MKKVTFLLAMSLGIITSTFAQEDTYSTDQTEQDYNKWSIEFSGGFNKPVRPVSGGYFTQTPSLYTVDLGARYMLTDLVGLKLDGSYNSFKEDEGSLPFDSSLYRFSLQGVVNAGTLLGLRNWSDTFNVLVHGGMGVSVLRSDEPVERDFSDGDNMLNFIVGVTPQVKLSDRIALNADLSAIGHVRQDLSFTGLPTNRALRGFDGFYVTATVGATIYLGKASKHADWYSEDNMMQDEIESIDERLSKVETDLIDTDQDGVPDYLDREPNTVSGVAVNTKGIAVDVNKNGIPDELESTLDARYARQGDMSTSDVTSGGDVIKKLIDDGYVNVYFKFNSSQPETYSLESINYLIKYMNENPNASAQLVGYADAIGNPSYNQTLSEKRAMKVKEIMVASGIDAGRLTVTGNGEDASVEEGSAPARQLVRRVTFKLN